MSDSQETNIDNQTAAAPAPKNLGSVLADFSKDNLGNFHKAPIPTGIPQLDALLNGGLSAGLILLGAQPSMGKSTLALQIAQNIAQKGIPAFYYSIEMTQHSIAAKALSRKIFCQSGGETAISANRFMNASSSMDFTDEEWEHIEPARTSLEKEFQHFYVIESLNKTPVSGQQISEKVPTLLKQYSSDNQGVVFVDYLQLLGFTTDANDTRLPDMRTIVDNNINYLKTLAHEYHIPVIIISSLSRNNSGSPVQTSDFKESGNIEYSADVLMAMQFSQTPDYMKPRQYAQFFQKEKSKTPRKVDLIILKQRYGYSGYDAKVSFDYYPATDLFVPADTCLTTLCNPDAEWINDCKEIISEDSPEAVAPKAKKVWYATPKQKLPSRFYINNTKLMQMFYKQGHFQEHETLRVDLKRRGAQKGTVFCSVSVRQNLTFTFYDKIVCDAVATLWEHYNRQKPAPDAVELSVTDILACMTGKQEIRARQEKSSQGKSSQTKERQLIEILEKLGSTEICIDRRAELAPKSKKAQQEVIVGTILPIKRIENSKKFLLDLTTKPPFYQYASEKKQVVNAHMAYLTCKGLKLSNTDDIIQLKHLLLWRLEVIRNEKNNFTEKTISYYYPSHTKQGDYAGIFATMGVAPENYGSAAMWSNRKQKLHERICQLLDYYQKIKYLDGYTDIGKTEDGKAGVKQHGLITGVKISGTIHALTDKELRSNIAKLSPNAESAKSNNQ